MKSGACHAFGRPVRAHSQIEIEEDAIGLIVRPALLALLHHLAKILQTVVIFLDLVHFAGQPTRRRLMRGEQSIVRAIHIGVTRDD